MSVQIQEIHRELIERCRENDNRAQYRLYKMYSKAMYNICIRMVRNKIDAEDILQEAFVKAFSNLRSFRSDSPFGPWLKRIVINSCIDFLKKRKLIFADDKIEIADETDDEKMDIDPAIIHEAIKALPDGARVVFNLFILEDYKHKEIADMLSISESTTKSQYQRARALLQDKLKAYAYEE